MLGQQLHGGGALGQAGLFHQRGQAAIDEEMRLRGIAQHVQPRILRGQCGGGEVDMSGDVLLAHGAERVAVHAVRAVAGQRAAAALGVVVLGFGKAVVNEKRRARAARAQPLGHGGNEGLRLGVDFRHHIRRHAALAFAGVHFLGFHRRAQVCRTVLPDEERAARHGARFCFDSCPRPVHGRFRRFGHAGRWRQRHAALAPAPFQARQQLDGHGIQHLIANDHAAQRLRQGAGPLHLRPGGQALLLARAQGGGNVHDHIALRGPPQPLQLRQQTGRQRPAARAKFPDFARARFIERLRHLRRQRAAKQGRKLRRGHEIAPIARPQPERARAPRVITQARCVKRQTHEFIKRQPAASGGDAPGNQLLQGIVFSHLKIFHGRTAGGFKTGLIESGG